MNNLKEAFGELTKEPTQSPVFKKLFSFSANRKVLQKIVNDKSTYSAGLSGLLELLWLQLSLGKLLPNLLSGAQLPSIERPRDLIKLAEQAATIGDWTAAYSNWSKLLNKHWEVLSGDLLAHISHELFKLDAFPEAAKALNKALNKEPNNYHALREQKDQYYYHAYSDWLMTTVEGETDWYKVDCLAERPTWQNAIKLCEPYVKKNLVPIAQHDLKQYFQAILLLTEESWDRENSYAALHLLREGLKPITRLLPNDVSRSLLRAVEVLRCKPSAYDDESVEAIQSKLIFLPPATLALEEWLCLYDILTWNGLLLAGYAVRQKAIEQAFLVADSNPGNVLALKKAVTAAMDQGNFNKAGDYLRQLEELKYDLKATSEIRAMLCLLEGDLQGFRKIWPSQQTEVDLQFNFQSRSCLL